MGSYQSRAAASAANAKGVRPDETASSAWLPIASAPKGMNVRVGHELDPGSMRESTFRTYGVYQDGQWECSTAFTCTDGFLRWEPTHWLPDVATQATGGDQ